MEIREVLELLAWILTGYWALTILVVIVNLHWVSPLRQAIHAFIGAIVVVFASMMLDALVSRYFVALLFAGLFASILAFWVANARTARYYKGKGRMERNCSRQ